MKFIDWIYFCDGRANGRRDRLIDEFAQKMPAQFWNTYQQFFAFKSTEHLSSGCFCNFQRAQVGSTSMTPSFGVTAQELLKVIANGSERFIKREQRTVVLCFLNKKRRIHTHGGVNEFSIAINFN